MKNPHKNTRRLLATSTWIVAALFWIASVWYVSAANVAVTTSATISISAQDQQLVGMIKNKIDMMSLEKTKMIRNRRVQIKSAIPTTHSQYNLVIRLDEYLQWSVDSKEKMMMNQMNQMNMANTVKKVVTTTATKANNMVHSSQPMKQWNTIADLAMSNPELSTLVDIVVYLDLADTLMADGNLTVFAPTNQAFQNALNMLGITLEDLMSDKELLTKIIMQHVIPMTVTAEDAMDLTYGTLVTTASGETVRVRAEAWVWVWIDDSMVVDADMIASNWVVHVIDKVLLPPSFSEMIGMMTDRGTMNIAEIAMSDNMFTTLVAGVQAADLADMLMMEGPYTVFAPTNDAFTKLLAENNMTVWQLLADREMLRSVISYHVVAWVYSSADIMWLEMTTMRETANWADISVDPRWMINTATITKADIYATNWVVHVIDEVLMP